MYKRQQDKKENSLSLIEQNYPSAEQLAYFFEHTERVYQLLGFIQNQGVMQKLKRLYYRAQLEKNELNILNGMLSAVEKRIDLDLD